MSGLASCWRIKAPPPQIPVTSPRPTWGDCRIARAGRHSPIYADFGNDFFRPTAESGEARSCRAVVPSSSRSLALKYSAQTSLQTRSGPAAETREQHGQVHFPPHRPPPETTRSRNLAYSARDCCRSHYRKRAGTAVDPDRRRAWSDHRPGLLRGSLPPLSAQSLPPTSMPECRAYLCLGPAQQCDRFAWSIADYSHPFRGRVAHQARARLWRSRYHGPDDPYRGQCMYTAASSNLADELAKYRSSPLRWSRSPNSARKEFGDTAALSRITRSASMHASTSSLATSTF